MTKIKNVSEKEYTDCLESLKDFILNYQIRKNQPLPGKQVEAQIKTHMQLYINTDLDEESRIDLFNLLKHEIDITIEETEKSGDCLEDKNQNHVKWLDDAIKDTSITWGHWNYYRSLILDEKNPSSKERFIRLDKETNDILGRIENPRREGSWDNRGLVVGDVQAGKTSNYIGLLAKAVDAGYKVIIVLAGSTNDLRKQTQERIDDGLLGYRSEKNGKNGTIIKTPVKGSKVIQPQTSSAPNGDYSKNQNFKNLEGEDCFLYVVKKNGSVLRNILSDLIKQKNEVGQNSIIKNIPLLMIDDEADNASPDTNAPVIDPLTKEKFDSEDYNPTCINRYIRAILSCFEKTSYIGYTATPYANIFELPNHGIGTEYEDKKLNQKIAIGEDLFPRNFIYKLYTPKNYIGIEKLFGTEEDGSDVLPVVKKVNEEFPDDFIEIENEKTHKKKIDLVDDPDSLKYAINCFILSSVAKSLRRDAKPIHNTMLVHINRLTVKHAEISEWVSSYLDEIKGLFKTETKLKQAIFFNELRNIWEDEYVANFNEIKNRTSSTTLKAEDWDELVPLIPTFIEKLQYKEVNGKTLDILDYDNHKEGLNVIAIGGDKLARGLTLQGLTVSYFLRKAGAYDTLAQMGRWFGYKDAYIDLCRIFMMTSTFNDFREIAYATQDLYQQFTDLTKQDGKTPMDFGLRILTDPRSKLLITAKNKSKNAIVHKTSFSGSPVPTAYLPKDEKINERNMNIFKEFLTSLGKETGRGSSIRNQNDAENSYFWEGVPTSKIIEGFLEKNYHVDGQNSWFTLSQIADYLKKTVEKYHQISEWTVVLVNGDEHSSYRLGDNLIIRPSKRTLEPEVDEKQSYYELSRRRLPTGTNEAFDLTEEQYNLALKQTNENRLKKGKEVTNSPSPHYIRMNREKSKALLLIYALKLKKADGEPIDNIIPGFMISFPELGHREMDQTFWANIVYERNGKTADKVFAENGVDYD